ncbi:chitin deacetylase-like 5 isoform X6 [Anticarsia gemmatalis]|uniref:chitin deacetylase-like 5 isoform X6 n=1 Tax=Anticarsia gemmatalis TaxID=129554 RepID=UPI003F76E8DF
MRSFGAAALFTLAIITECYGAQSDRSRSRSGPVRSVPVAADIKRDADFDCPEEFGYYPHPTDCSLYYVCVFGGALLESCTGGLMYSHELQTCDWPRNVGCDGTSAGGEELERVIEQRPRERQPPPPPPRRTPPPPPLRAQPNPVVTSRGQPKFNRQEYEKQQQLYAEVDDLPPVEEIESDRQQRVYRGQPPTIGQVQKDRDGYGVQQISSGRNLNSNIIPASIPQNSGKIGSFSFGSQVDERRTATVTPAPQSYSEDKSDIVTDSHHDRHLDVETNEITTNDLTDKPVLRKKREVVGKDLGVNETSTTKPGEMSKRSDSGEEMEYVEIDADSDFEEALPQDDTERGKRQIRYYLKNGYKSPGKNWGYVKPVKVVEYPQTQYSSNSPRYQQQQQYNNLNNNNYYDSNRRPQQHNSNSYQSAANPFLQYQSNNFQSHVPFRPSLPDPSSQTFAHNPLNSATQIITKSPPISALNGDPYSSLAGGFYNNAPRQNINQAPSSASQNPLSYPDSSYVPSTVVTGKPVPVPTSPKTQENYRRPEQNRNNYQSQDYTAQKNQQPIRNVKPTQQYVEKRPSKDKEYDDDDESKEEDDESYEDEDEDEEEEERFKHDFKPPYEFTHPSNKYKEIENPFANPDFDFDAYLAKISNGQYSTGKPEPPHKPAPIVNPTVQVSTVSSLGSTVNYIGMSTPKPFTLPSGPGSSMMPIASSPRPSLAHLKHGHTHEQLIQRPEPTRQIQQQHLQQQSLNENVQVQHTAGTPLEAVRPKLKPPNFKDDRQLPISYSFSRPITSSTPKPYHDNKSKAEPQKTYSVTQKPFVFISSTGSPLIFSTPKHQYIVKPENIIPLKPVGSAKPYLVSSIKPHNAYIAFKQSTPKPLTTIANEQLSALQQYWNKNPTTEIVPLRSFSFQQSTPAIQKLENLFSQVIKSTQSPVKNHKIYLNNSPITTTARPPAKRRPIPKPSPEMNDYYYEDDEQYFEPAVKPKYMPSTEIKPQRPPMAQNYKEYDDSYEDDSETEHARPQSSRIPLKYKPESATKNHNDVSIATKVPLKNFNKNINGKIPIPVLVDYNSPTPNTLIRPEVSNYQIVHHMHRNRTMHIRRPVTENGPNTVKPPKYLNQTTLRPYTVRHRLAKPTTVKEPSHDGDKQTRGRVRHPNIVAQMKLTTPRDSHNQETRYTKIKHDDKTNSLEPTESVTPVQYSASPRPKMLYNGTQNYSPDQYDPFYAVYDEDGELYKDTDYVQQYNTASLRPVVQQTYRGTPPPARRPVETYTPRPSPDDYDDELIQPQINTQNQYQTPIRHSTRPTSTRGRGSAHYSTASGSDSQSQPAPNRGTPPTRNRPTLKPSTAIVSENVKFSDIYTHPASRPAPVYPQPTPDKTAAKCRKDVCLLPDCYCGGKDIPGDLPVDQVPQIVLLTFDDSVNDLNKGLYADLFEKGRVNPNGCPISATFYVSHEWTDYSQVQNLYAAGHEMASHTISHSFGEQFSQKKWYREVGGQREILAAYGGVKLEDVRGMRAPFLSVGGNKMFKMLYDANFTYDSSLPVYENRPPSWPYTLDYKLFHDCMIPPCPTKSYPGVWEVPMVMWQDLNGGRCSMGDACANPPEAENVYKMILKNFDRHYTTNRAPFGLFYHAAWFTQPHHKEGFIMFLDFINQMPDVWIVTNWQALQWVRDPTPVNRLNNFQPFQCNYQDRPKKCNNPKVCNLWHKSGVRYMRTCQPCPEVYPWTGKSGIRSSRIDNDIGE